MSGKIIKPFNLLDKKDESEGTINNFTSTVKNLNLKPIVESDYEDDKLNYIKLDNKDDESNKDSNYIKRVKTIRSRLNQLKREKESNNLSDNKSSNIKIKSSSNSSHFSSLSISESENEKIKSKKDINNNINIQNEVKQKRNKKIHIIIDSIESIYSKQTKKSFKLTFQFYLLISISLFASIYHYLFLLITTNNQERNYCFDNNLNQFTSCAKEQVCKDFDKRINILIYNDSYNFNNDFFKETHFINTVYKNLSVRYIESLINKKILLKKQIEIYENDRLNLAILLTFKERWKFYLNYYNICHSSGFQMIMILCYSFGGGLGSIIIGFLADIFGRRKMIILLLSLISFFSFGLFLFCYLFDKRKIYYQNYFDKNFQIEAHYYHTLKVIYYQNRIRIDFLYNFFFVLLLFFFIGFCIFPLQNISLSLLMENCFNENLVKSNFRFCKFCMNGIAPFLAYLFLPIINKLTNTFMLITFIFIIILIFSIFFLDESMRHLFEYCEWRELSKIATSVLLNFEEKDYCSEEDLFIQEQFEENHLQRKKSSDSNDNNYINNNLASSPKSPNNKRNSLLITIKNRINELNKSIRRNSEVIIKKKEIYKFPYLIITCLYSNRIIQNFGFILFQSLILVYLMHNLLERELYSLSFFNTESLYIGKGHSNIIINNNYFILMIIIFISNIIYNCLFIFTSFKIISFVSLFIITILSVIYYSLTMGTQKTPLNLSEYNFSMYINYQEEIIKINQNYLIFFMYFFMNGIELLISLIILKYSRTLYRCTFLGIHSLIKIITFATGKAIRAEMEHIMLFAGVMNLLGIFTNIFMNDIKEQSIINDIKKKVHKVGDKHEENNDI